MVKKSGRPKVPVVPLSTGLPPKQIILDQVIYWIELQATASEIAASFHVSTDTLQRRLIEHFGMGFADLVKRCDGPAKLSLRRYQFKQAEKNTTMAIWLGKIWLGQRDKDLAEFRQEVEDVRSAIRELQSQRGRETSFRSVMEDESSLSYQGCQREQDPIQDELGTTGSVE